MYFEYELSAATPNGNGKQPRAGTLWMFNAPEALLYAHQSSPQTFVIKTQAYLVGSLAKEVQTDRTGFYALGRRPPPDLYAIASVAFPIFSFPEANFTLELQGTNYVCTATFIRQFRTPTPPFADVLSKYKRVNARVRR